MSNIILIIIAGGLGALARYGLSILVQSISSRPFPWGTMVVNVLGCFVFGVLWSFLEGRLSISAETRAIILVGFMGSFTTFSTYMFETSQLLKESQWLSVIGNVAGQNIVGIAVLFLGLAIGRFI